MFTFEQITELVELVAKRQLAGLEIEKTGFRLKIEGQAAERVAMGSPVEASPAQPLSHPAPRAAASSAAPAPVVEETTPAGSHIVTSPIVGTFYRSPAPEAPPFMEVGSRISKGQVLCIIEAMKLMNEIESDVDGVVVEIYPQNAQPVEYGERLFAVRLD